MHPLLAPEPSLLFDVLHYFAARCPTMNLILILKHRASCDLYLHILNCDGLIMYPVLDKRPRGVREKDRYESLGAPLALGTVTACGDVLQSAGWKPPAATSGQMVCISSLLAISICFGWRLEVKRMWRSCATFA